MAMPELMSFAEDRGTFELAGVHFAITSLYCDPGWSRAIDYAGVPCYARQPADIRLEAVGVELITATPFRSTPPTTRRPPLMRWANIRRRRADRT